MEQFIRQYCELLDRVTLSDRADRKIWAELSEKITSEDGS